MSAIQQLLAAKGGAADAPSKTTTSTDFDTTTRLSRGANMTGVVDSATGALSVWFRVDGGSGVARTILYGSGGYVSVGLNSSNKLTVHVQNAAGNSYINMASASPFIVGSMWHHLQMSWDLNAGAGLKPKSLFIDGVNEISEIFDGGAASVVDYTTGNWFVSLSGQYFNGCLSELWFAPGQFLDFNVETNRSKFRNRAGHPIDLGADGSVPTGTPPALYLSNSYATFPTNNGTGGNFTVISGALTAGSTSP